MIRNIITGCDRHPEDNLVTYLEIKLLLYSKHYAFETFFPVKWQNYCFSRFELQYFYIVDLVWSQSFIIIILFEISGGTFFHFHKWHLKILLLNLLCLFSSRIQRWSHQINEPSSRPTSSAERLNGHTSMSLRPGRRSTLLR